ncbi:MAG: V-type ATPase subunit [Clostridia bacterium]|nr:V-type ATPase subunit [Clostridia bacterium]
MHELEYVYAVARIRSNENSLLNADKIEQLINASDYAEALKKLGEIGYDVSNTTDVSEILLREQKKAWDLLVDIAPDKEKLEFLTVRNSFMNLKAALKSFVSGQKADEFLIQPANVPNEVIVKAVTEKDFSILPEYMVDVAKESYEILTQKADGQLSDTVIDKKSLETFLEFAKRLKNETLTRLADFTVAVADMKIAYRAALTGKDKEFLDAALAQCSAVDISLLKRAALDGTEKVIDYIARVGYKEAAELLKESSVAFEKWCDDHIISAVENAKYEAFGFLPLAGYYFAKENEIKTVRIVMAAKENSLAPQIIRERVRRLYV